MLTITYVTVLAYLPVHNKTIIYLDYHNRLSFYYNIMSWQQTNGCQLKSHETYYIITQTGESSLSNLQNFNLIYHSVANFPLSSVWERLMWCSSRKISKVLLFLSLENRICSKMSSPKSYSRVFQLLPTAAKRKVCNISPRTIFLLNIWGLAQIYIKEKKKKRRRTRRRRNISLLNTWLLPTENKNDLC